MTIKNKAAFIATSHSDFSSQERSEKVATGLWLSEFTTPYYILSDGGLDIDVYSIQGGNIPVDPNSVSAKGDNEDSVERFMNDENLKIQFNRSQDIGAFQLMNYDVIFLPGGHGTMWDYPASLELANIISASLQNNLILAAVCHGPAGLTKARDSQGRPIVQGRKITGFSNTEEQAVGLDKKVPFLLESRLRELGAEYRRGPDFKPFTVQDENLITGQNPASAESLAIKVLEAVDTKYESTRKYA